MTENFLPFALPEIGEDEINEVVDSLRSGWITTGPKAKRFEQDFSEFVGVKHSLAVNSATSGLHLALEVIGVGSGDTVITTPYTFTATAEVVRYLGAEPIFVDIDPATFNIDPAQIRSCLLDLSAKGKKLPKAIIPVHFGGQSCDMEGISQLANEFNLKIIEDAAHALPCTYKGKMIGTIGDITVYSFYVTKTIVTGEGGMVVTDNDEWASRIKIMRLHGISRDVFDRYTSIKPSWFYEVVAPGFKYNMADISAAIGIHQLKKAEVFRQKRESIAQKYNKAFADLPLRIPYLSRPEDTHSWHLYVLQLELEQLAVGRDRFIELMSDAGIGTSVHFIPLHIQPYWRDRYGFSPGDFPMAYDVFQRAVSLPIYPKMTDMDVERVIGGVRLILQKNKR
jgi:dTDP-4-amino-4,6-dideoxygalactose transaminase